MDRARGHPMSKVTSPGGHPGAQSTDEQCSISFAFASICVCFLVCLLLSAHCFSMCFAGFSSFVGLSMLVFLGAQLLGLSSYPLLSLDNLNYPRETGTRSVQAPDKYIQLPSIRICHTQVNQTQYNRGQTCSFSSTFKFASPSLSWQMPPIIREEPGS